MSKKPRNMLSAKDVFRLNNWVEANKANFKGRTRERIAADASKALAVEVTIGNLIGAFKVCDVTLGPGSHTSNTTDRVQVLAQELAGLFTSLGQEVPEKVKAIATRRRAV